MGGVNREGLIELKAGSACSTRHQRRTGQHTIGAKARGRMLPGGAILLPTAEPDR